MWVNEDLLNKTLDTFTKSPKPLSSAEADTLFEELHGEKAPSNGINSAIAALEKHGYLIKAGKIEKHTNSDDGRYRKVKVNTWASTAKLGPVDYAEIKEQSAKTSAKVCQSERQADFIRLHQTLMNLDSLLAKGNQDADFLRSYVKDIQQIATKIQMS